MLDLTKNIEECLNPHLGISNFTESDVESECFKWSLVKTHGIKNPRPFTFLFPFFLPPPAVPIPPIKSRTTVE
jgi:hypothetical protein